MNAWKVICAALVIFAAGVITGGLTVRLKFREVPAQTTSSNPSAFGPLRQRGELLDRMQRQLYLTTEQRSRIEQILKDSHEHMKQLWDSIAPQAQLEHRKVHDLIKSELTAAQQDKFEEIFKSRSLYRPGDGRRREERQPKTQHKVDSVPGTLVAPPRRGNTN